MRRLLILLLPLPLLLRCSKVRDPLDLSNSFRRMLRALKVCCGNYRLILLSSSCIVPSNSIKHFSTHVFFRRKPSLPPYLTSALYPLISTLCTLPSNLFQHMRVTDLEGPLKGQLLSHLFWFTAHEVRCTDGQIGQAVQCSEGRVLRCPELAACGST